MALSDERLAKEKNISVEQVRLLRQSRGTTNETLEQLPENAVRRAVRRLNYPDLPRARHAFRVAQAKSEDGHVPPNALGKALKELRAMRAKATGKLAIAGVPTERVVRPRGLIARTAGLSRTAWQWLGPGNIGGRTRGVVVHPTEHDRIWAASAGGGIWHTADAARTGSQSMT
ncbi:MAG: hypothetical protein ACR2FI_02795 [Burkholderiales bacterium]|nr:hypothetical protein [Pseudomonadota bacterium]